MTGEAAGGERVRIKLRVGDVDVEVECGVGEVGNVVDEVLRALAQQKEVIGGHTGSERTGGGISVGGRGETCKGIILNLWRASWFELGRALGEVHGEMGRSGFHYDRTAVAHALVDLVREGVLTRVGRPRRYRYVQKRPPLGASSKKKETEI